MQYINIKNIILFASLFIAVTASAQFKAVQNKDLRLIGGDPLPNVEELHIGDAMPDILIENIINDDATSLRTGDYKDKLLVLDFWTRYCSTCIASMPKLDSLQRVFGDQVKLLSVTYEDEADVSRFYDTNKFLKSNNVSRPTAVQDDILRSHFPYRSVPHIVWIYKGKVVAITRDEYVKGESIQEILDGKPIDWGVSDHNFDPSLPFLVDADNLERAASSAFYNYSELTGEVTSVPVAGTVNYVQDSILNYSRVALFNWSILDAYRILLVNTRSTPPFIATPARVFLEVKDPSRMQPNYNNEAMAEWNRKNLLCYEMVKHGRVDKVEMAKLAVQDLNNKLGLDGRYEKRKVNCLVFVKTDQPITDTLENSKGGMIIPALSVMRFDMKYIYPPTVDETGYTGGLNMQPDDGTVEGLRKELQRHGLDLIEAEREIECLVISEK